MNKAIELVSAPARNGYFFITLLALLVLVSAPLMASANAGYGGPGMNNVAVCKTTSSQFRPFVLVTVPQHVADRFLAQGGVLPVNGACPAGVSVRDFVAEKTQKARATVANRLAEAFSKLPAWLR